MSIPLRVYRIRPHACRLHATSRHRKRQGPVPLHARTARTACMATCRICACACVVPVCATGVAVAIIILLASESPSTSHSSRSRRVFRLETPAAANVLFVYRFSALRWLITALLGVPSCSVPSNHLDDQRGRRCSVLHNVQAHQTGSLLQYQPVLIVTSNRVRTVLLLGRMQSPRPCRAAEPVWAADADAFAYPAYPKPTGA